MLLPTTTFSALDVAALRWEPTLAGVRERRVPHELSIKLPSMELLKMGGCALAAHFIL